MTIANTSNARLDPADRIELTKYMNDVTGARSGKLIALWPHSVDKKYGHVLWTCLCDCGNHKVVISSNIKRGLSQSCGCSWTYRSGSKNARWSGYEGISGSVWNKIKTSAKKRSIPIEITIVDAWNLFTQQNGKCVLTGVTITLPELNAYTNRYTASLDRIDSSVPYTIDNIQWVHKDVNRLKIDFGTDRLFELCKQIVVYNNL